MSARAGVGLPRWGAPQTPPARPLPALTGPSPAGEPWCPTVQEISQAFTRLGADLSPLCRQGLLPPELCPADGR